MDKWIFRTLVAGLAVGLACRVCLHFVVGQACVMDFANRVECVEDKIMKKYGLVLFSIGMAACGAPAAQAQNTCMEGQKMNTFLQAYLPTNYGEMSRRSVQTDGEAVELVRYQPAGRTATEWGGEHFSTVFTQSGCLKGFAWMSPSLVGGSLPDKAEAQAVADRFLRDYAPDLGDNKEINWVDKHDEPLQVGGQKNTLTGMKVKMRNPTDGRWFWVIVGNHGRAMVFERDIVWVSFPGHRQTEKWLHDEWLETQEK